MNQRMNVSSKPGEISEKAKDKAIRSCLEPIKDQISSFISKIKEFFAS